MKVDEAGELWETLHRGDWLIPYQHAPLFREHGWGHDPREKFRAACGVREVETFEAHKIAGDVAFFAAEKR